jgi:hypothetical protein
VLVSTAAFDVVDRSTIVGRVVIRVPQHFSHSYSSYVERRAETRRGRSNESEGQDRSERILVHDRFQVVDFRGEFFLNFRVSSPRVAVRGIHQRRRPLCHNVSVDTPTAFRRSRVRDGWCVVGASCHELVRRPSAGSPTDVEPSLGRRHRSNRERSLHLQQNQYL